MLDSRALGQLESVPSQLTHQEIKMAEALVASLPLHVTKIDLLNHNSNLEASKGFIKNYLRNISTSGFLVAIDDLLASQPARSVRNRAQRTAFIAASLHGPIAKKKTEVYQRISDGTH